MKNTLLFLLCTLFFQSCNRQEKIATDAENILFEQVSELGANGKYREAIEKADSILLLKTGDSLRAYIMLERMVAIGNIGNINHAIAYADTVAEFGERHGIGEVMINAMTVKGAGYRRKNQNDSALAYYRMALQKSIDENNKEYEQYVSDLLSILYTETSRTKEALVFSQRSLDIAREAQDTTAMVSAIATIGSIYMQENKFQKVLDVQLPYMPMLKNITAGGYIIKFLTPVIKAYLELNSDSARYYIQKAEPLIAELPESHQSAVAILNAKAELLGKEHRYKEELDMYNRIDSLGTHGKPANVVLYERAVCHDRLGDNHRAFTMMKRAYAALDSIRKDDNEKSMSDFAVKYHTLQKEMEIEKMKTERLIWTIISITLIATTIITIMLLRYKNEKIKQRMTLEKQNTYIRGLETERERIAKELHDGICNEMLAMTFTLADNKEAVDTMGTLTARIRQLSHELMPPQFKNNSLCQILINYVMTMNDRCHNTHITITDEGCYDWEQLSPEHSFELYRIVQESVGNALKHAKPSYIAITLNGTTENYLLTIENDCTENLSENGENSTSTGIGKQTLRARAASIGANINIMYSENIYKITIQH